MVPNWCYEAARATRILLRQTPEVAMAELPLDWSTEEIVARRERCFAGY